MGIWKDIKSDHFDDDTQTLYIDAFLTEDDNEEGKVIATITNGVVTYKDARAATDSYAQEVIQEEVKLQIKELILKGFYYGLKDSQEGIKQFLTNLRK